MSSSLRPHGPQHARPHCPSPTPRVYPNSRPLSRWCHPIISSSVVPFSSCLLYFPSSGSFQMSQLFASGGQSIGVSASTSVLPMNTQDWSPLVLLQMIIFFKFKIVAEHHYIWDAIPILWILYINFLSYDFAMLAYYFQEIFWRFFGILCTGNNVICKECLPFQIYIHLFLILALLRTFSRMLNSWERTFLPYFWFWGKVSILESSLKYDGSYGYLADIIYKVEKVPLSF